MNNRYPISLLCTLSLLMISSSTLAAQTKTSVALAAECTTDGTEWNGARNDCRSARSSCETAPEGHVVVEKSIQATCTSCNGSENSCDVSFDDYVEVIKDSGIKQPRTVCLSAFAKSPGGMNNANARGWAKCVANGNLTTYN